MRDSSQPTPLLHPSQRFSAPAAIQRGVPLRNLIGREMIELLAESFAAVADGFDSRRFIRMAVNGLEPLELKQRGEHVARALMEQLPPDFRKTAPILIASLGPELTKTDGNGLAPFFYLPHAHIIATHGVNHFEEGMEANYQLTKRFTGEFSIRPFLAAHQAKSLRLLMKWADDPNPHVRRLVSEGSRPRLPWAMRLPAFCKNPRLTLPLLEKLKDDPELYVRRSVANHLADILKDHPEVAYKTCERWTQETNKISPEQTKSRHWIVCHAIRLPAKKGVSRATKLRKALKKQPVRGKFP